MSAALPLDREHPLYRGWWEGVHAGELRLRTCLACDTPQWPPRLVCVACGCPEFDWRPGPQEGVVHTITVMRRAFHPAFADRVPLVLAVVDVVQGVRILGELVDGDPDGASPIGRAVHAAFVDRPPVGRLLAWQCRLAAVKSVP